MWNITVFNNGKDLRMYEFNTEKEAKNFLESIQGNKILTQIVYFNDPCFDLVTNWIPPSTGLNDI